MASGIWEGKLMMSEINVIRIDSDNYIGVYFSPEVHDPIEVLRQVVSPAMSVPGAIWAVIKMPCGQTYEYQTEDDFPRVDVPCRCGAPGHWAVKYGRLK